MRVHRNILPRCWVIQAEQEKGGKDMTLPEQERERFCQVLHHSRTSLYRLAFSITRNSSDAQEAVAEAVCRAYERYPQLREKEKLPRGLLKITANEARRLCQRRGRTVSLDDLPTEPAIPGRETGDDTLWQAVQTLPRDQREAVVLFYYEDLPTEEIARIVGTSPGAVRVRLSRAREKLRSILKEGDYG